MVLNSAEMLAQAMLTLLGQAMVAQSAQGSIPVTVDIGVNHHCTEAHKTGPRLAYCAHWSE